MNSLLIAINVNSLEELIGQINRETKKQEEQKALYYNFDFDGFEPLSSSSSSGCKRRFKWNNVCYGKEIVRATSPTGVTSDTQSRVHDVLTSNNDARHSPQNLRVREEEPTSTTSEFSPGSENSGEQDDMYDISCIQSKPTGTVQKDRKTRK